MGLVAVTDINHGYVDDDGDNHNVHVSAGESVEPDDLTQDDIDHLVSIGSVVEETLPEATAEKIANLEDEIASLRAQLGTQGKQNVSQAVFENSGGEPGTPENTGEEDEGEDFVDPDEAEAQARAYDEQEEPAS